MADLKHPGPRISLQTRLGHVNRMANTLTRVNKNEVACRRMKEDEATLMEGYSADCIGTFKWLIDYEADIKALVAIPAEDRAALLAHLDVAIAAAKAAEAVDG